MTDKRKRIVLFITGLCSWGLIFFAWAYLEHVLYLSPCQLCMMQRVAFALVGLMFIIEALWWPQKPITAKIVRMFKLLAVFFGIGLAARHLYIQQLPADQVPSCGLDFWGTLSQHGWLSGMIQSMKGSGDCAEIQLFLGLSIPIWSLIAFILLLFIAILFGNQTKSSQ